MKEKLALHLVKGDVIMGPKGQKAKVETVIKKNDDRLIELTVRDEQSKRILRYDWKESIRLWSPPKKNLRYGFLFWLAKKLNTPIKRGG